jgi:hypothetical protein
MKSEMKSSKPGAGMTSQAHPQQWYILHSRCGSSGHKQELEGLLKERVGKTSRELHKPPSFCLWPLDELFVCGIFLEIDRRASEIYFWYEKVKLELRTMPKQCKMTSMLEGTHMCVHTQRHTHIHRYTILYCVYTYISKLTKKYAYTY